MAVTTCELLVTIPRDETPNLDIQDEVDYKLLFSLYLDGPETTL